MAESAQYVTLGMAGELFAAPVERVQEILELRPISRLPRAPRTLLGMIDVRGQSIPVMDLRATLGLPAGDDNENTRIVVLKITLKERDLTLALKTDRVFEVTGLDEDKLEATPEVGVKWNTQAIAGIGRRNGAFVTVIDLDNLFAASELEALKSAQEEVQDAP